MKVESFSFGPFFLLHNDYWFSEQLPNNSSYVAYIYCKIFHVFFHQPELLAFLSRPRDIIFQRKSWREDVTHSSPPFLPPYWRNSWIDTYGNNTTTEHFLMLLFKLLYVNEYETHRMLFASILKMKRRTMTWNVNFFMFKQNIIFFWSTLQNILETRK